MNNRKKFKAKVEELFHSKTCRIHKRVACKQLTVTLKNYSSAH